MFGLRKPAACTGIGGEYINVFLLALSFHFIVRTFIRSSVSTFIRSYVRLFDSVHACTDARSTTRFGELVLRHVVIVMFQWTTASL